MIAESTPITLRLTSLLGIFAIVGIAWAMSVDRKSVRWRPVMIGVGLQASLGVLVLNPTISGWFYAVVDAGVKRLLDFANKGGAFVFGSVVPHQIADANGQLAAAEGISAPLQNIAFTVLPTIIFFSALTALLYYMGVMQGSSASSPR